LTDWLLERLTFRNVLCTVVAICLLGYAAGSIHTKLKLERTGALAYPEPVQEELDEPIALPAPEGYTMEAFAEYEVRALVLSSEEYSHDRASALSPIDLALGWGVAATPECFEKISFRQSGRWYHDSWGAGATSLTSAEVAHSSANTHIIPSNGDAWLRRRLLGLGRGDAVRLKGYLVRVTGADGYKWRSSSSRTDSGDGSCEILYVTELEEL